MVKLEDILFWIFISIIIGTSLWMLHGSPIETSTLITIGLAVAGSELLIWRYMFSIQNNNNNVKLSNIDKSASMSFMKVKHDMEKMKIEMNNRFDNIDNKLDRILKG